MSALGTEEASEFHGDAGSSRGAHDWPAPEVVLAGRERLRIEAGVDITTLRTVLAALRERA